MAGILARKRYHSFSTRVGYKSYVDYDDSTGVIVRSGSKDNKYHGGGPHADRGDHTTAMATFVDMVQNCVYQATPTVAIATLRGVVIGVRALPGMQQAIAAFMTNGILDEAAVKLDRAELALAKKNDVEEALEHIASAMDDVIVARNHVPLSAKTNPASTRGSGEAAAAGDLDYQQKQHEQAGTVLAPLTDDDRRKFWTLLDMRKRPTDKDSGKTAAVIHQHLISMRMSYRRLFGPEDFEDLVTWADKNFWVEGTTIYSGWEEENAAVIGILMSALENGEMILYANNPDPHWQKTVVPAAVTTWS